eukprot:7406932-Lingulodinium_polyedra.AAC.1
MRMRAHCRKRKRSTTNKARRLLPLSRRLRNGPAASCFLSGFKAPCVLPLHVATPKRGLEAS